MLFSFKEEDGLFQRIIWMSANFRDEALRAFSRFVQHEKYLESTEALYKAVYDSVCIAEPYKFAPLKSLFDILPVQNERPLINKQSNNSS